MNATVGSGYPEVWRTACSTFASKSLYTYGDPLYSYSPMPQNCCEQNCNTIKYDLKKNKINQAACKYQWLCHECKLQLSLTIPHLLLTRQANTSSCLAAKQSLHRLFSQVIVLGSQHTKAVWRDTHCSGEGDGEWVSIRQGVNCTISTRRKPSFKYVLKNSITASTANNLH